MCNGNSLKYPSLVSILICIFIAHYFVLSKGQSWLAWCNDKANNPPQLNITSKTPTPVIIYSEEVKKNSTASRSWPTIKILRKVGENEPQILAEVGKVGEYPNTFTLSPDKNNLIINLESKLQLLDLATGKLKDLFSPKKEVLSSIYSPDHKQLFIWDQKYASYDNAYFVHLFNLYENKSTIIKEGNREDPLFAMIWRRDNMIILSEPQGEYADAFYFNLKTKEIIQTPGNPALGPLSQTGMLMAIISKWVDDICMDLGGASPSIYNIIDPVSGKTISKIGDPKNCTAIIGFSPDDQEILYSKHKPGVDTNDCYKIIQKTYYKTKINDESTVQLKTPQALLTKWYPNNLGAQVSHNQLDRTWSILINGAPIVTSNKALSIIAQYYQ